MSDLDVLARRLDEFANARGWGQFHTPKNLAMAIDRADQETHR